MSPVSGSITRIQASLSQRDWQRWAALSPWDPTVSMVPEQERALIEWGLAQGAVLGFWERNGQVLARAAWKPLGAVPGDWGLGFLAWHPELSPHEDSLAEFLRAVGSDIRASGGTRLVAPVNWNSWFPYRLRCDAEVLSFSWEPARQPALEALLQRERFRPDVAYHSVCSSDLPRFSAHAAEAYRALAGGPWRLEILEAAAIDRPRIAAVHALSLEGFRSNPYFETLDLASFLRFYWGAPGQRNQARLSLAWAPDGEAAGFLYTFYEAEVDAVVLKSCVVAQKYQGQGLSNALIGMHLARYDTQPAYFISALVKDGQRSESYARHGQTAWTHRYLLYARDL